MPPSPQGLEHRGGQRPRGPRYRLAHPVQGECAHHPHAGRKQETGGTGPSGGARAQNELPAPLELPPVGHSVVPTRHRLWPQPADQQKSSSPVTCPAQLPTLWKGQQLLQRPGFPTGSTPSTASRRSDPFDVGEGRQETREKAPSRSNPLGVSALPPQTGLLASPQVPLPPSLESPPLVTRSPLRGI